MLVDENIPNPIQSPGESNMMATKSMMLAIGPGNGFLAFLKLMNF